MVIVMYSFKITDEPFARGYLGANSDSRHIRTGMGFVLAAQEMELSIDSAIGLPNAGFSNMACAYAYASGEYANTDLLDAKAKNHPDLAEDYNYIKENMLDGNVQSYVWGEDFTQNEIDIIRTNAGWGGTWGGHSVPDLIDFAKYGTGGLRDKVNHFREHNPDASDFYDGILLMLDAVDIIGERFHSLACNMAQNSEGDVKRKLARLAKAFERCPKEPASNFVEACIVYIMMFTLDGIDSPGHFDWYMIDFWRNTDYAEAREMLEDVWVFFNNTRTWNLCIGGSDENWNDITNELTYEILDVAAKYKFQTPNITMRCHRNTPEKLLRAAAKTIATGIGMPTLYNDEAVCPALERVGIPPADSHRYVMNGCNQIDIQGRSHMGLEDGEVNMGMAVELAMFNGTAQKSGKKIGAETGDVSEFDTFDKFYAAVKEQIRYITDAVCSMSNKGQRQYALRSSNPIRSLTTAGCLESGRDYKNGGPLYGHGQILAEGVPDAIDSVAAVKKFVYEDKLFTITELRDALAVNFEGHDNIYRILKGSKLHFGNDDDYVDDIAKDLVDGFNKYLLSKPTFRGGFFGGGCSPFSRAAQNGGAVGALPNGKRADEDLYGDSIGATPGRDAKGPTALLASCLKFDHTLPTSGFILNVKFDKKLFGTEKGIDGFLALQRAYFGNKGQQLSVTVVSREELLDAVEHPDEHRDLIVRVGGYSDYFVNLPASLQQNVIARTNYEL